jgi:transcription elongation GreA/GreB family factor
LKRKGFEHGERQGADAGRGLSQLTEELKRLKMIERPEIVEAIEEARAHGDLSARMPNIMPPRSARARSRR